MLRKAGVIFLAIGLLIILRGCVFRPATEFPGDHFNLGKNAAWIGIEWVNEVQSQANIADLADLLHKHQITYAFVYVSYWSKKGDFNATYDHASDFLAAFRQAAPDVKVLAWIGLPLTYADLNNQTVRLKTAVFCQMLVQRYGFDGIHLDPEPIIDGDARVLTLLDEIRLALPPHAILSLATHTIRPVAAAPFLDKTFWSIDYYAQIAQHVDQIAVMTYDSTMPFSVLYRLWSRFQVIQISKALAGSGIELFFGIPASEEETTTHHSAAENVLSGLQGVIDGLNDSESQASVVTGVALYPLWEIDSAEWATFDQLWLGIQL